MIVVLSTPERKRSMLVFGIFTKSTSPLRWLFQQYPAVQRGSQWKFKTPLTIPQFCAVPGKIMGNNCCGKGVERPSFENVHGSALFFLRN